MRRDTVLWRFFRLLKPTTQEILYIFFYAIMAGSITLSLPLGVQSLITFIIAGTIGASVYTLIGLVLVAIVFYGIFQIMELSLNERLQQKVFIFTLEKSMARIVAEEPSAAMAANTNKFLEVAALQKSLSNLILDLPTAFIQIFFGLVLLAFYHPVFILFDILLVAVLFLVIRFTSIPGLKYSLEESNYKYKILEWFQRMAITEMDERKAEEALERTDGYAVHYLNARTNRFRILRIQYFSFTAMKVLVTAAMLILGTVLAIRRDISLSQFVAAEIVIILILNAIEKLMLKFDTVYNLLTASEKLQVLTPHEVEKKDFKDPNTYV